MISQQTIKNVVTLSGIGLHTGQKSHVTFKPAAAYEGICFVRVDLPHKPVIQVNASTAVMDANVTRCTALEAGGVRVYTVEHVLAALSGLGVDNIVIEIDGQEAPGLDGSSLDFVAALKKAGIVSQEAAKNVFAVKEPIVVANKTAAMVIVPAQGLHIFYTLDYDHPALRSQIFSIALGQEDFVKELAPARTFCLESETEEIRAKGLGKGANHQNTLVMSSGGPLENKLRFPNECARHKALDIIGDLSLLGVAVHGAVYATKSGHVLNRELVKQIEAQRKKYAAAAFAWPAPPVVGGKVFNIEQIMAILPHRYPFLFVDRVIEVEPGKKGIGIKNVTMNDGFFQGHFPQKPVMPGVIMVEAMAQTAGVIVLTSGEHNGKVALFMSLQDVKFRRVVLPGDQMLMEVEIIRDRERTAHVKGVGKVDGEVVVEAQMMFSYTDASYLNG